MAFDGKRFGTRISLSDRFALIRKEAQKRSIMVNPTIDMKASTGAKKNFNGTVSRNDRPSARLEQGSERNKRLVHEMASTANVLAEINQTYSSAIMANRLAQAASALPLAFVPSAARIRPAASASILKQQQVSLVRPQPALKRLSIKQRLGQSSNGAAVSNVKQRLGIKRKPISERIGTKPAHLTTVPIGLNRIRTNLNIKPSKKIAFKSKAIKLNNNNKPFPIKRLPVRTPTRAPNTKVTAEQLDMELESYMQGTKSSLNADLDAYMAEMS